MDKTQLFGSLSSQETSVLLDLLSNAYDRMNHDQRQTVFGQYVETLPLEPVDEETLLVEIKEFQRESLAGAYYAPFNIKYKNLMHVPEETKEWFERLGGLLKASCLLTERGDHEHAAACFGVLFELINDLSRGKEIVFGDEIGTWMIPGDEKQFVAAYMTSLAATANPEEFAVIALPIIRRDSWESFTSQAYTSAIRVATEAQRAYLEAEIQLKKIKTKPTSNDHSSQ